MKKMIFSILMGFLVNPSLLNAGNAETAMPPLQGPHVVENIPEEANFDEFLTRDLQSFFAKTLHQHVSVKYEMLRDGPTQSGTAHPKYYLWVKASNSSSLLSEGAARVAAVKKTHFEITDFLSKNQIHQDPGKVTSIFPKALYETIVNKAK